MMRRILLAAGVCIAAVLLSFAWYQSVHAPVESSLETQTITLMTRDGTSVQLLVEIADDDSERTTGLMHRTGLPAGQGMLFVFDRPRPLAFWMKNTLIPLDILYFDAEGTFVSRMTMEPCREDPCLTYSSGGPAMYALEVNAGESLTADVGFHTQLVTEGQ